MKIIARKRYISDKEASTLFGYSQSWFQKRRYQNLPPKFLRLENKGRIYYPLEETEEWFNINFK